MGKRKAAQRPLGENVGEDSTPLDERVRLVRRRRMDSPEYLWIHLRERQRSLTIAPGGRASPGLQKLAPEAEDRLRDLPARLNVRAGIAGTRLFKPSAYPGLSQEARSSGEEGWLAWEILPYLIWLGEYVRDTKPDLADVVGRSIRKTTTEAEKFLRTRLNSRQDLSVDARAILDHRIGELFRPLRLRPPDLKNVVVLGGNYEYPNSSAFIESRARDREIVNTGLGLPSAWEPLPPLPNLAKQIVTQMKAKGYLPSQIMSELSSAGLSMTPEGQEVRAENLRWIQEQIDQRFNSDDGDAQSTTPEKGEKAKSGPDIVVVTSGVAVTDRQIAIGRVKAAYLEAHGKVDEAREALKKEGHPVPKSTFYDYLTVLDAQERGWRNAVMNSEGPGIPEGTRITRSRRKTRANGS